MVFPTETGITPIPHIGMGGGPAFLRVRCAAGTRRFLRFTLLETMLASGFSFLTLCRPTLCEAEGATYLGFWCIEG